MMELGLSGVMGKSGRGGNRLDEDAFVLAMVRLVDEHCFTKLEHIGFDTFTSCLSLFLYYSLLRLLHGVRFSFGNRVSRRVCF